MPKGKSFPIQIVKFLFFSGIAALVNIGARMFLSNAINLNFYLAICISYFIGMIINFALNKNFNFPKGPRKYIQEMRTFFIIALFGLFLTNFFSAVFLQLANRMFSFETDINKTISHILAVGLVSIYSFIGHKYFTFRGGLRIRDWFSAHNSAI